MHVELDKVLVYRFDLLEQLLNSSINLYTEWILHDFKFIYAAYIANFNILPYFTFGASTCKPSAEAVSVWSVQRASLDVG